MNQVLTSTELERYAEMDGDARLLLNQAVAKFNLSARSYHRIVKVARTIADLGSAGIIQSEHLAEALNYRCLDKSRRMI